MRFRPLWTSQPSKLPYSAKPLKYRGFLISLGLFAVFVWFLKLPAARNLDLLCIQGVHAAASPFLTYALAPFVMIGSVQVAALSLLIFSASLYRRKEFQKAYLCVAALLVGSGIVFMLKANLVSDPPPRELLIPFPVSWNSISIKTPYSFPSGHMFRTALFFLFLICWFNPSRSHSALRRLFTAVPVITGFAIVYYGFHWPSDILGGAWLAWLCCQAACRVLDGTK